MATCRACKAPISFVPTERGKLMPTNADGSSHFGSCAARVQNRPPAPPDNVCASCGSDNVERLPGTGPHFGALRCHDCNAHRWLRWPEGAKA